PSVLITPTSFCGVSVLLSVKLLLLGLGSTTPAGGVTEAVLARLPVSVGMIARVRLKLAVPPGPTAPVGKLTGLAPGSKVAPPVAVTKVVPEGSTSLTVAPVTLLGPLLVTVIV